MSRSREEIVKRIQEIDLAIATFVSGYEENKHLLIDHYNALSLSVIQDVATIITTRHYSLVDDYTKLTVKQNTDRHKIASITELLIVTEQPIRVSPHNEVYQRWINATLAFTVAAGFEMGFSDCDWGSLDLNSISEEFNREFAKIVEDHIAYMEFRNPEDGFLPIISNSEFWRMLDFSMQMKKHIYYPGGN